MKKYDSEVYDKVIQRIEIITGKSAPHFCVIHFDTEDEYAEYHFSHNLYIPEFMRVTIDTDQQTISTFDDDNINLYILFYIYGKFDNMHYEWYELLRCYAKLGFPLSSEIHAPLTAKFPQLMYLTDEAYLLDKAKYFASMTEKHGFKKMIEWLESPDLLYCYESVFGEKPDKFVVDTDVSFYENVLRGEQSTDNETNLALWIDDFCRPKSRLDVIYSDGNITKAAILTGDVLIGFADIRNGKVTTYIADYVAWERRRAAGYAKNNPINEESFYNKVLSFSSTTNPKILEIGIGTGRIAKPFVVGGSEYHGVDINTSMLDECKNVLGTFKNLHLYEINAKKGLPFEDKSFDIILECRVFGDIPAYVMSEMARVIKDDGVIIYGISDNSVNLEKCSPLYREQNSLAFLFENAYFDCFNIARRQRNKQKMYGKGVQINGMYDVQMPQTENTDIKISERYTRDNPFSVCSYRYSFPDYYKDNIFHMAFFRQESLFEPCGTDFFKAMKKTAETTFGTEAGICTRYTYANIILD